MADFVYLPARGRIIEIFMRMMLGTDPDGLIWAFPVVANGAADADLVNADNLAGVFALGVTEPAGWYRQALGGGDLAGLSIDQPAGFIAASLPTLSWPGVPDTADASTDLIVAYAQGSPTDPGLYTPLTQHDYEVTPNGALISATSNDFYRAT